MKLYNCLCYDFIVSVVTKGPFADVKGTKLTAFSGGGIIVKCGYDHTYRDNRKSFCKGKKKTCQFNMLSQSTEKRFTLYDTNDNNFLVLMRNLTAEDSGTYQCLVELKNNQHLHRDFNLEVTKGETLIVIFKTVLWSLKEIILFLFVCLFETDDCIIQKMLNIA